MNNKIIIGYAGMTHLGINYAIAGAGKNFNVIGYDPNANTIQDLTAGKIPVIEPGLDEALQQAGAHISFTAQISDLATCDIVYIAPDISTNDNGQSDLTYIRQLIAQVIPVLNPNALLVILAQVPPGFTRQIDFPATRLYYQVETLVFGLAVQRATQPERYIVGCANPDLPIDSRLNSYLQAFNCPLLPMRYESAELAKIAINCCLVAAVSVANSLAEVCENIGADWNEIVPALRLDKRIGQHAYLQAGLGLSGGNLERDLATVVNLAAEFGTDKQVIQSFRDNSAHRRNWPLKCLYKTVLDKNPHAKIAVWGLTYKENTHSLKNSPAVQLLESLTAFTVSSYDPVITPQETALGIATGADVLVIMTPWAEFKLADLNALAQVMRGKVIIDPFRVLASNKALDAGFEYYSVGRT